MTALVLLTVPALAVNATDGLEDIGAKFDVLKSLAVSIISGIGMIICLWGIAEWGLSLQSPDGGMTQAQSLKRIGGGLVMIFASQILALIV